MSNERKKPTRRELVGLGLICWVLLSALGDVALSVVFPKVGWGFYVSIPVCAAIYIAMNTADEWPARERPRSARAMRVRAWLSAASIIVFAVAMVVGEPLVGHASLGLGTMAAMLVVAVIGAAVTLVMGLRQARSEATPAS